MSNKGLGTVEILLVMICVMILVMAIRGMI